MKITEYNIRAGIGNKTVFVFLSDIHEQNTAKAYELTERISPDAVLVGGDYVQGKGRSSKGLDLISRLSEKYPVFVSLGNHEFKCGPDIKNLTVGTGAVLLDNSDTFFHGVRVGGLTSGFEGKKQGAFRKTPPPDTDFIDSFAALPGYKILLCHHPEYYQPYLKKTDIQLILSGHAHGGQWRIFGRGLFAPGQGLFPKYTSGMYEDRLIVSRGIGDSHIIPRINNECELVVITIE